MNRFVDRFKKSAVGRSVLTLPKADRKKIIAITFVQISLGILDLLGVVAIGLLGALSAAGLQGKAPDGKISSALDFLNLTDSSLQAQAITLSLVAVILLVGRTLLSVFFTRRILFFLSRRGAQVSADLISRMLSQPLLRIQERTTQETLYAVTRGVELIVLQILATSMVLVSDLSLLLIMSIGLFLVDPTTAMGTLIIFAIIGYFLYKYMHVKAGTLGVNSSKLNIASNSKIVEVFSSYRESVVRNRRDFYAREIGKLRFDLADTSADINFMPYVSKYVIETSVILGALLIGAIQFILQDATHAIGTLTIFLAAGTRIAPAVLRVQQGMIAIRGSIGQAKPTLDLLEELGDSPLIENTNDAPETVHEGFTPIISIKDLIFKYPGSQKIAIDVARLEIPAGSSVAIVGSSGAGKTTLIDILLGVIKPDAGQISISGLPPLEAITRWPGAISYVPQDVVIAEGSIRENIGLGFPPDSATNELVMHALEIANLESFVDSLPNKLESQVGERGANISGGQRQRLGIARALFTHPLLLVLDEATSSLDGQTESSISQAIQSLKGHTTVVMIAHRLSTVKNADLVVYLADGKIIDVGSFEEIRNRVPDFDLQAKLVGL